MTVGGTSGRPLAGLGLEADVDASVVRDDVFGEVGVIGSPGRHAVVGVDRVETAADIERGIRRFVAVDVEVPRPAAQDHAALQWHARLTQTRDARAAIDKAQRL